MTLRSNDLQSDSDLDSIRNSCDVCTKKYILFPITVNVILLFVRRLKTEIVIDNVRKKTLKYMYDTCPC